MEKKMNMIQAIRQATREEMLRDENVFLMGEDIGAFGGIYQTSAGLKEEFGAMRVIDTPISEQGIAIMATGAAMAGKRPMVDMMYADFSAFMFDSIVNEAAKQHYISNKRINVPIVFRASQGAAGGGGGCHHSQSVESWFMNAPGVKIVCPSDARDAKGLLKAAIRDNNPVIFLEHKRMYGNKCMVPQDEDFIIPIGKARVIKEGTDVTVIANQMMLTHTIKAAEEAEAVGISVEIIDPRTIKPFDREAFTASVKKTGRVIIVHECPLTGGYGAEFAAAIQEDCFKVLKAPIKRVCGVDAPLPAGIMDLYMVPDKNEILETIKNIVRY